MKIVLTLSHAQTSVERGFSHDNTVVQTNMSAESVISKRLINDHMLFHKLKPYTIEITDPMIRALNSSHPKYQLQLESEKQKKGNSETDRQLPHLSNDIDKIKAKVK